MIVFNLQCGDGHGFEAWFKDAKAYESQRRGRKVACPVCGATKVSKVPSAPRIARGADHEAPMDHAKGRSAQYVSALDRLHRHMEENCDYVGARFAEEARDIHHGVAPGRGIYGEATKQEAEALTDDGVPFAAIPKRRPKDA